MSECYGEPPGEQRSSCTHVLFLAEKASFGETEGTSDQMTKLLRRLRGLLGVGITWGTLWGGIGAGIGLLIGVVSPDVWLWTNPILDYAIGIGLYGFFSGVGFGTLLSVGEGRRTILDLSLRKVAVFGVLGAVTVPLLFGMAGMFAAGTSVVDILEAVLLTGVLGGTFAPGSVAIAGRAELREAEERDLLTSRSDSDRMLPG